jgi:MFS family permease
MDQSELVMPWIVAITSIVVCIGLPLSAWILFRYFAHRERIEMIRHGMAPSMPPYETGSGRSSSSVDRVMVRGGISLFIIGLIVLLAISSIAYATAHTLLGPWLLGGILPMLAGIAEFVTGLRGRKSAFDDSVATQWWEARRARSAGLESQRQEDRR